MALQNKRVISVRETRFELQRRFDKAIIEQLVKHNPGFFEDPSVEEHFFLFPLAGGDYVGQASSLPVQSLGLRQSPIPSISAKTC